MCPGGRTSFLRCALAALLVACGGTDPGSDAGTPADGGRDAAQDAGLDSGALDSGALDSGMEDAGTADGGGPDGGPGDAAVDGGADAGPPAASRLFDVVEFVPELPAGAQLHSSFAGDASRDAISVLRDESDPSLQRVTLFVNDAGVFRETASTTLAGFAASVLGVEDFDGDGVRDIVLLRRIGPDRHWQVLYSAGDGTVARVEEIEGDGAEGAIADWNGDGEADLVFRQADGLSRDLRIWMSNPTDDTRSIVDLDRTLTEGGFVAGDFDGDTRLDLLALPDQVYLQGATGFGAAQTFDACMRCEHAAAGDLNGDGRDDVVAVELGTLDPGRLLVFEANPDGTFRSHATHPVSQPRRVRLADVDRDGALDAVVSDGLRLAAGGAKVYEIFFGDGLELGGDRRQVGNDPSWEDVEVFDLDGDGQNDLISNGRFVTYGAGRTLHAPTVSFWTGGSGGPQMARFDGDARPDAVFTLSAGGARYHAMGADRTVGDAVTCTHPGAREANRYLDVDGDGRLDALHVATDDLDVWLNRGGCERAPAVRSVLTAPRFGVQAVDVTGDATPELIWRTDTSLEVAPGMGGGAFAAPRSTAVSAPAGVLRPGRVDGDLHLDLLSVAVGATSRITILLGAGDGTFTEGASLDIDGLTAAYAEDVGGDGDVDLFVVTRMGSGATRVWLRRNEAGVFGAAELLAELGPFPMQVRPADFDQDGSADLLVVDREVAEVLDVSGASPVLMQRFPLTDSVSIVDVDEDSDLDLVAHLERTGRNLLTVIQNRTVD